MARHKNPDRVVRVIKLTLQRGRHDRLIDLIDHAPRGQLARHIVDAIEHGAQPAPVTDESAELEDLLTNLL